MQITIIGTGRAGSALALALSRVGHRVALVHHDDPGDLTGVDLVLLAVPDDALAATAERLVPGPYVLAHVAGSRGLDVLAGHERVGFVHPLAALSSTAVGATRLRGAVFSVGGDALLEELVTSLGGRTIRLEDDRRAGYHATASVAANHLVALLGHVEALAEAAGLTLADFLPLVDQALEDVRAVGPRRALTGPASRADMQTIDAHLAAIPDAQRSTYVALANAAFELAESRRQTSLA